MFLYSEEDELIIESRLGVTFPEEVHPYPCIDPEDPVGGGHGHGDGDEIGERCLEWKNLARLRIKHQVVQETSHCYT